MSNTTRVTSSNPLMDNFPMMPPLTGLGISMIAIIYIYDAPTALLAETVRLQNVQTLEPAGYSPAEVAERRLKNHAYRNRLQLRSLRANKDWSQYWSELWKTDRHFQSHPKAHGKLTDRA